MALDTAQLGAFIAATLALVGSPGPATLGLAGAGAAFGFRAARRFLAGMLCGAATSIFLTGTGAVAALLAVPGVAPLMVGVAALYMFYLAYRIATAPPLAEQSGGRPVPGFLPGLLLALMNPKGYAVFATLFAGFVILPDDPVSDAVFKGVVIMAMLTAIDTSWLYAGGALRHWFEEPITSRRVNIGFAVLLLASVLLALAV
jgi:threonine/homoserine/homoserine lactone efflux protein